MAKTVLGSILHGAYGDLYEQALCLKHFAQTHPDVDLRLFAVTTIRLEAFRSMDLSFASSFDLWTEIERQPDIEKFMQFQVTDQELHEEVLDRLPPRISAMIDRDSNLLPWDYMREHHLIPEPASCRLNLSEAGKAALPRIAAANGIREEIWRGPTVSFLWRRRTPGAGAISGAGQKSEAKLVADYSAMFHHLIRDFGVHVLVCGMNVVTDDSNRARTDNKYTAFGLNLPPDSVTYLQGLSWPIELEIASRATVSCGNASGFTEGLWLKRGGNMILMDAPHHYLAKIAYHRMPLFNLNHVGELAKALLVRSGKSYGRQLAAMLANPAVPSS